MYDPKNAEVHVTDTDQPRRPNGAQLTVSAGFLAGGGETGALMRSLNWSSTPFGAPDDWPQSLQSAVSICLGTKYPIAIYWGPELALIYNDAWSDIPGEKHPWALGRPGREVWPEIWDTIGPLFESVQATGEGVWQEDQLLPMHRHGYTEECYFNFTFSPIRGENGGVEGIFNAVVETTFRVIGERRERTLRELAERVASARSEKEVFALAVDVLGEKPEDLPFCLLFSLPQGEGVAELVASSGYEGVIDAKAWLPDDVASSSGTAIIEDVAAKTGRHIASRAWPEPVERAAVAPIGGAGNGLTGYLVAGISPRRAFDDDYKAFITRAAAHIGTAIANVRAYEEERKRAEALAALDQAKTTFFSNVSHEFRTPLTLMLGPIEEALDDPKLAPNHKERMEIIHRNGLRLLKLVNSLLDFSRVEAGKAQAKIEPTDLSRLTSELASTFRPAIERAGLSFTIDCRPLSHAVGLDREMWEKIVLNLLSNAFKFTLQGEIVVSVQEADGRAIFSVRDTGTGIPKDQVSKLFERFHRVDGAKGRSIEGTGIGLALVQELVSFHGGFVTVETEENKGSTFTVSLPLDASVAASGIEAGTNGINSSRNDAFVQEAMRWLPSAGMPSQDDVEEAGPIAHPAGTPLILLADDNADMRDYVWRLLSDTYQVDVVSDGLAALDAVRERRPDVLLTDIMMPGLDGFGLIKSIRTDVHLKDLPIIALSARAGEEAKEEGLDAGADDYLVKPFSARELRAVVKSNLELARMRREMFASLQESEARFRNMADHAPVMMWVTDMQGSCTYLNRGWYDFTGQEEKQGLGYGWLSATHPDDKERARATFQEANRKQEPFRIEYRLRRADEEYRWAIDAGAPRFGDDGAFLGFVGSVIDITDRKRAEGLQHAQATLLEAAMQDIPLGTILDDLVRKVEALSSGNVCAAVMLADQNGKRLLHAAAPNLPAAYRSALEGVDIAEGTGSCGTAAFRKQPVCVQDIATDPLWESFRELALKNGLRACFSTPILSSNGQVIGAFALYYPETVRTPTVDRDLLEFGSGAAALIIERRRAQDNLRRQTLRLEALNRTASALAGELDLDVLVQMVTDSGVELTGAQSGAFFYSGGRQGEESSLLSAWSGLARGELLRHSMPRDVRSIARIFEGQSIVRSDDITADVQRFGDIVRFWGRLEGQPPLRSFMAVPILSATGEIVGGLFFGDSETQHFTNEHETLVRGIAGQASVALENARLFKTAQREIEHRKAAEEELGRLNAHLEERIREAVERAKTVEQALRQSQKMEAIGQLTGGIAHDFNNLLQVVSGNLQLLGKDIADNPTAQKKVANALEGVARGSKLASHLLAFGRRQALDPKVVNIGRFVAGMEEILQRTLGEAIEIEIIRSGGLWNTFVHVSQVENAILNLAINARDAMDGSGKLTIEVGNAFLDEAYALHHDDVTPGQYVMLAMTDTGSGMTAETISKVFDPFFTTKPVGKGTGLGLSMVHGFVKQSGGHIKIYSEVGEGTSIKIYFPRSAQQEDALVVADHGPVTGGTETILVAEDDEKVRETVVAMLTDLGYKVLKAKDATAALTIIESGIAIDLLFTDVIMPGPLKAADMARQARERVPYLGVLFTSGYTENSIVHGGKLDPGVELLSKPYSREALARKVRHVLNNALQAKAALQSASQNKSAPGPASSELKPSIGRRLRVLLVEDNQLIRMSEADMLEDLDCDVIEAGSAEEALPWLEQGGIEVLISDLGLPGMSGEEFCREVRRRWPDVAIVFATGMDRAPEMKDASRTALLHKPHGLEELKAALEQVLGHR